MKPDHFCVNHLTQEAISFCHHCEDWVCSKCVWEGPGHYYCQKPSCQKALKNEKAIVQRKCPGCGKRIIPGAHHCDSCGKKLRELNDEEKRERLITVARYNNPVEARLAQTKLESEGIEAYIADEQMVSMNLGYNIAFGGVRLQVKKSEAARVTSILGLE